VKTGACLTCHSEPYDAPQALTRSYGTTNGFGWKLHETIGAQILTVPMAVALKAARDAYVKALIILAATFAIVFVVMNLLLHYAIIAPVKRVSAMAEAVSLGQMDAESYIKPGKDEISVLSVAFNRMRESLKQALGMIG
jgi:methyl-accepting chemotaxis protein